MINDKTTTIEQTINQQRKPSLKYLLKLWVYVFKSTKVVSIIYLSLFIALALLRPLLAFIWGIYIRNLAIVTLSSQLIPTVLLIVSYFLINFLCGIITRYVLPYESIERLDIVQANHQQELLHSKMYAKLARISPEYFEVPKINDTIAQVFDFVDDREKGMNHQVLLQSYIIISSLVTVISIAASLYIFNPWLCLIVLLAPLSTIYSLTLEEKLQFKFVKENTMLKRKTQYFQDLMISGAAKELKTLGLYDFIYSKWKELADEYTIKEKVVIRNKFLLDVLNYTILTISNSAGLIMSITLLATGAITLSVLGIVISLINTLIDQTSYFLYAITSFVSKKNEAALFYDIMEIPEQPLSKETITDIDSIQAKDIKYRYPLTDKYVLNGISIQISKGEKIAFVGENGMGKTTFVKLIMGLLQPSEGQLLINDIPVENLDHENRFSVTSTVSQTPVKYHTFTIQENVFLGNTSSELIESEIDEALDFAGLADIDKNMLLGKDIGGTDLSGGQWQKLALAKARYRNRNMIILDEPTSNLDPIAETEVFKKYISLASDKTVIFVTHRISVAALANRIIVFKDGKIIQDGNHAKLIKQDGEYRKLYNEQAKWYNR